jgi:hypothetical protein
VSNDLESLTRPVGEELGYVPEDLQTGPYVFRRLPFDDLLGEAANFREQGLGGSFQLLGILRHGVDPQRC